jgi:hypothetical protein
MIGRPDPSPFTRLLHLLRLIMPSRFAAAAAALAIAKTLTNPVPLAWITRILIGLALGVAVRIATVDEIDAEHPHQPHKHLGSLLRDSDSETNCIQIMDGSIGHDDARNRIRNTLYTGGTNDWDGIAWVRFEFQTLINPCPPAHSGQPIRVYFRIDQDLRTGVPPAPSAARYPFSPTRIYNPATLG